MTVSAFAKAAPIRFGADESAARAVQLALRGAGFDLEPDGEFGKITTIAVKSFQASNKLKPTGEVDAATAALLDKFSPPLSVLKVAPWLSVMRAITGTKEAPGARDNPYILEMAHEVTRRYPDLKGTVGWYNHDSIPWCGLGMAYSMAMSGIRPPDAPLSALSWASWGQKLKAPTPGAVLVYTRTGGGHVTLYESEDSRYIYARGSNQSDSVNITLIQKSRPIRAIRWPSGVAVPTAGRKFGATGNAVAQGSEA